MSTDENQLRIQIEQHKNQVCFHFKFKCFLTIF